MASTSKVTIVAERHRIIQTQSSVAATTPDRQTPPQPGAGSNGATVALTKARVRQ